MNEDQGPPNMLHLGLVVLGISLFGWMVIYGLYWAWSQ